jgi:hypothetical protein
LHQQSAWIFEYHAKKLALKNIDQIHIGENEPECIRYSLAIADQIVSRLLLSFP